MSDMGRPPQSFGERLADALIDRQGDAVHRGTTAFLSLLRGQHDRTLHATYTHRLRNEDIGDIARDPETAYHIEAVEAINAYLEDES